MIIVLGSVITQAGRHAQALALSQQHVARSRLEPGCIAHGVHPDPDNPQRLVFVEQWTDQAALFQHFKVPASRDFVRALAALCTEPPNMTLFDATELRLPERAPPKAS
ncbi:MAG: antibiotic biosynthesis monooxygenase [Burkholderiales bacterium]|nr:antibiotic biosynthesis monooxygenase [Burkholderiales bacterium]